MPKIQSVNIGMNRFCGPAVLSILTGKSTDACAGAIYRVNPNFKGEGVHLSDLLKAANNLGFDNIAYNSVGSLYNNLVRLVHDDGIYIVTVPHHFTVIEVNNKKILFCDNHTKEPMPAMGSARLTQQVLAINKVIKRPDVVVEPPKPAPKENKVRTLIAEIEIVMCSVEHLGDEADTINLELSNDDAWAMNSAIRKLRNAFQSLQDAQQELKVLDKECND